MGNSRSIYKVKPAGSPLIGRVRAPGDKSIAHRALLLAALGEGPSRIVGLPDGEDVRSTIRAIVSLGVRLEAGTADEVVIDGVGIDGLLPPAGPIDCGGSATTARLLAGVLAGRGFFVTLMGDASLSSRPMRRVVDPLQKMGAKVFGRMSEGSILMPLVVGGDGPLEGISHRPCVASAQVKSCVLLAGLRARGMTSITEPAETRDHTEVMLRDRGVDIVRHEGAVSLKGPIRGIASKDMRIPGDPSSASFLLVAALLIPGSRVVIEDVCLNPTRLGFVDALRRMGAAITAEMPFERDGELWGRLEASGGERLRGAFFDAADVARIIDEIPILAVAAAFAEGVTIFSGCSELRAKESDRLSAVVSMLRGFGLRADEEADCLTVHGRERVTTGLGKARARVSSFGDHRVAMAAVILGLASGRGCEIEGMNAVSASYPGFIGAIVALSRGNA